MINIDIKECQSRLKDIAVVVSEIAAKHSIPFFMLGGTMLGAIRHRGFIPWDDDMDFGVTYENFYKLIDILREELPTRYRCLTCDDDSPVSSFFFKVEDTETLIDDPCIDLPIDRKIGLNIDVFPIISCNEVNIHNFNGKVRSWTAAKASIYNQSPTPTMLKTIAKKFLRFICPLSPAYFNKRVKSILDRVESGNFYCNVASPQFWRIIWPKKVFDELDYYEFDTERFLGPKDYDYYLSKCYKNYMQLPPKEKQRVHATNAYKK